ncbi:SRPBCC family protein [Stenotrophomonas sp. NPDC087984]
MLYSATWMPGLSFDDAARSYGCAILDAPFPVTDYLSTLTVREVPGRSGASYVEWSGTFTPTDVSEHEAVALFHGIYADGLAALRKTLEG